MLSNTSLEFDLYQATKAGQDNEVIKLLEKGVNPSGYKDVYGNTALHIAVTENKPSLVAILLEHGADFLHKNRAMQNPLELATYIEHWNCILVFGKYNEKNYSRKLAEQLGGPLLAAVRMGEAGDVYIKALLNGKADPNVWRFMETEEYALHIAVSHNSAHIAQLLVEKGADTTKKNKAGDTPAVVAAKKGHWDCVNILMRYKKSTDGDEQFGKVLLIAVGAEQIDVVRGLLEQGISPNYYNEKGYTALHFAIMVKKPEIIALLLAHNADPLIQNFKKSTPFSLLTYYKNYWDGIAEFAKYNEKNPTPEISEAGCILLIDTLKVTPIREDHVVILLKGKADVNVARDPGTKQTALHIAAVNSSPHIVLALLKTGADMTAVDVNGDSAVTLAAKLGNWANVKALARFKNKTCVESINHFAPALLLAVQAQQYLIVEDLLKAGASPNSPQAIVPATRNTPLHEAARLRNTPLLSLLLRFDANRHLTNKFDETPVDITIKLQDQHTLDSYDSPKYFPRDKAREILFIFLLVGNEQSQFFAILPPEIHELIFQYAFSAFTPPNDFQKYLANMRDNLLLCSIKALQQHIAVHSQKKLGLFSYNSIKIPTEIETLSIQLQSACEEISSSQTKVGACKEIIADFTANYLFEPSWSSAGIDLLIRFHLVNPNYDKLTLYIRQVNSFRRAIAQTTDSLPMVAEEPIVNTLCQQLKIIYDFRGNSHLSTVEEQLKERIKAFVDQYGHVKEAMTLLAKCNLLPRQSIFEVLTLRSF